MILNVERIKVRYLADTFNLTCISIIDRVGLLTLVFMILTLKTLNIMCQKPKDSYRILSEPLGIDVIDMTKLLDNLNE